VKNESFWQELVRLKFEDPSFDKIAFVDLDVPAELSPYILNVRSQLIYDQFAHFIYDFELDIKSKYREYCSRLVVHEVILDAASEKELKQLENKLNEIPICMLTVETIYDALLETIAPLNDVQKSTNRHSLSLQSRKPFEIAAFGKTFRDCADKWQSGWKENFKIYSNEIFRLESLLHDIIWQSTSAISIERRQILNYFMGKIAENLSASGDEKGMWRNDSRETFMIAKEFFFRYLVKNLEELCVLKKIKFFVTTKRIVNFLLFHQELCTKILNLLFYCYLPQIHNSIAAS
jgi:hypothetical protein